MKYLVITILALAAAVLLGHFIADDAGFVVIGYAGKVFRTSFVVFVVILIVALTALYIVWRILYQFLTLKTRWLNWSGEYRRKRSQRALNNGLIALAEGHYTRAEQLLSRGADAEATPALHYIGAAEAAQAQHADDRRDNYLSLAQDAMPSAEIAIGVKRAQMQFENGQVEQARAGLEYLADRHPDNGQVLALQQRVYSEVGDAVALTSLLPALRRHRVFPADRLAELEIEAAGAMLARPYASVDELHTVWRRLPKSVREQPSSLALYATRLTYLGYHEEAEGLLRKKLARTWDGELVEKYGEVRIQNAGLQLERAETWLATREEDPDLLLCVAKLSQAAEDWDKTQTYLERLIAVEPSPLAYRLLAEVHDHHGAAAAANECRSEGLRLATGATTTSLTVITNHEDEAVDGSLITTS